MFRKSRIARSALLALGGLLLVCLISVPTRAGTGKPLLLVHGYNPVMAYGQADFVQATNGNWYWVGRTQSPNPTRFGVCKGSFGDLAPAMEARRGAANVKYLGYYTWDQTADCNDNFMTTADVDMSIPNLAFAFAGYVYTHYAQSGVHIDVLGHSMGGIIVRHALTNFPTAFRYTNPVTHVTTSIVDKAITVGSPHGGATLTWPMPLFGSTPFLANISLISPFINMLFQVPTSYPCDTLQCRAMMPGSDFLTLLNGPGPLPSGPQWKLVASSHDHLVSAASGVFPPGASSVYVSSTVDHFDYFKTGSDTLSVITSALQ